MNMIASFYVKIDGSLKSLSPIMNYPKSIKTISMVVILSIIAIGCNNYLRSNKAKISFSSSEYDFGVLGFEKEAEYNIALKNPGEIPLVIYNVKASCGCTTPEWPKRPIKPGQEGALVIRYDASHPGKFKKAITIYYNGEDSPKVLTVKGEVEYPENFKKLNWNIMR